jgi:hypothetical protein
MPYNYAQIEESYTDEDTDVSITVTIVARFPETVEVDEYVMTDAAERAINHILDEGINDA